MTAQMSTIGLAGICWRTRRPDAVKSFESALSMSGDFRYSDSARYLLGTTLRELGKYDRAIAVFREIEELERDTNVLAEGSILAGPVR